MKALTTWKTVFAVASGVFLALFIMNFLLQSPRWTTETAEMIARRPFYLILAVVFFVAALILGIVKRALEEEKK